ncbi:general substrate transporter [Crepidotus variabilis]|uniref:General substrate transporter n=1 Tax=Crepidotus variabilis TaxID=179855 RepID=A0A9P6EAR8_9AGAR|nr:general substrate transporter [Crepidotus variabilis]
MSFHTLNSSPASSVGRLSTMGELTLPFKAVVRLHVICIFFALASFIWGYNIGILATVYVHPGFIKAIHRPTASDKGLITAIYYLGTWISYIFLAQPATDYLGRRWAVFSGTLVTCIGAAIEAASGGGRSKVMATMIIGRIVCGLGLAIVSSSVPLYQSEISPAKQRGRYVVLNHVGMIGGLAAAFWIGYAFTFWDTARGIYLGWRLSIAVQFIPATILFVGLPFCPETPRWLVQKGRHEQALSSLMYLRGATSTSDPIVTQEYDRIKSDVAIHQSPSGFFGWTILFTDRSLFRRLWRASLLHFMAQMCGNTAIKYYLPTIFEDLGIEHRFTLLVGGVESTLKIGCTIFDMLVIDKLGRRVTLLGGIVLMTFSLLINGALPQVYPDNVNRAADYACIVFIFFYTFGYSVSLGPAPWVYSAEIFPTKYRARGVNFAASGGAIGSIIVAQVWPIGIQNIGSKTYFIFMSFNIVAGIIVFFLYPETKGIALEDMDNLFFNNNRPSNGPLAHRDSEDSHEDEDRASLK